MNDERWDEDGEHKKNTLSGKNCFKLHLNEQPASVFKKHEHMLPFQLKGVNPIA